MGYTLSKYIEKMIISFDLVATPAFASSLPNKKFRRKTLLKNLFNF